MYFIKIEIELLQLEMEPVNKTKYEQMRDSAADTFTPFRIKDLSEEGKRNMGTYGIIALTTLFVLTILNLWALVTSDADIIVIFNSILAFVVSLFTLEKLIASILHILLKQFK